MGRHRGGKRGLYPPKSNKGSREGTRTPAKDEWQPSDPLSKQNALFEEYYTKQAILPAEEMPQMLQSLAQELPTTFRVTGSRAHAETINDLIKTTYLPTLQNVEWDGVTYAAPQQIPWYPGKLAWQLSTPKRVVRKTQPYKHFQKFLVGETEVGNLSRQEAVSMIPPLFLDVQSHHNCLDMCAAPGSKTAQIIEALNPHDERSTGFLIANDSDYKRTHMLVHQTGRMPSRGLMITNLDAAYIPNIDLGGGKKMQFDRILADVPCSGDGTLRKNMEIWRKWGANDGNSLHALQLRILDRGLKLLKPGGRIVYSTCSFNPAENESVVAAALNLYPGQLKLVDVSDHLPELKRRPGLTSWKVATQAPASQDADKPLIWHDTFEEYEKKIEEALTEAEQNDKDKKRPLPASLWPPANANELNLERCMRLVPHDQDTGGFFVCVLEKLVDAPEGEAVAELPPVPALDDVIMADEKGASTLKRSASPSGIEGAESEAKRVKAEGEAEPAEESAKTEAAPEKKAGPSRTPKKVKKDASFKEDPYSFVDPNHEEVQSIVDWFKLDSRFARDKLMVRNDTGSPLRTLYVVNDTVKAVLQNNDFTRMRIISAGVKAFVRQDSSKRGDITCKWRVPGEGMIEIVSHLPEDVIINATIEELRIFLSEMYPPIERFAPEVQTWMQKLGLGNAIVRFQPGEMAGGSLPLPLILPVWKANTSVSLLIDKKEKATLSQRVFGEDLSPVNPPKGGKTEGKAAAVVVGESEAGAVATGEEAAVDEEEAAMNA